MKEAVEQYRRFIELWRECDPEFQPLLREAETALRRLAAEPPLRRVRVLARTTSNRQFEVRRL
jgi:hypothetical protein